MEHLIFFVFLLVYNSFKTQNNLIGIVKNHKNKNVFTDSLQNLIRMVIQMR